MWFEGRFGGTDRPMIWVHAGPAGAHPMGFHVSQQVWDYVTEHGLDLSYNRKFMQAQLDGIKALLEGVPVQAAVAAVKPVAATAPWPRYTLTPLGWALGAAALATAGVFAVRRRLGAPRLALVSHSPARSFGGTA